MLERAALGQWQALQDDRVIGRGETWRRLDGRLFISIDAWNPEVFDDLATAMLAELPRPLHTMVDEADTDLTTHWQRAGFTTRRREWQCHLPTDPATTGLNPHTPGPSDITVLPLGTAEEEPLRELDRTLRTHIQTTHGWQEMPAEVLPVPEGTTTTDPSQYATPAKHAVAVRNGTYAGLIRVTGNPRMPRIGLIAVHPEHQRHGIARTLLTHTLSTLHRNGITTASAEINESNTAATTLFTTIGAQHISTNLELELH
ncbi:GNAT family N-acetyltransferase [Streptomyces sp. NBC_00996]|uniref:GNAT family N-acetyltransferase n=1 Tax=Streptomyces sp. NBC_00996 TaxID=2903710 RepID=UPI00386D32ED